MQQIPAHNAPPVHWSTNGVHWSPVHFANHVHGHLLLSCCAPCYALTCTTSTALGLILSYSGVEGMWEGVNGGGEGSVASQGVWGHSLSGCSNVWCSMFFTLIWLYIVLKEDSHEGSHAGGSGGAAGRLGAADAGLGCMGAYALHRRHRCRNVTLHSAGIETHSHQKSHPGTVSESAYVFPTVRYPLAPDSYPTRVTFVEHFAHLPPHIHIGMCVILNMGCG